MNNFNACGKVATWLNDFGWVSEFGWMIDTKSYSFEVQMKKVAQWSGDYKSILKLLNSKSLCDFLRKNSSKIMTKSCSFGIKL